MARNGELSKTFGVYRTLCCDAEIVIGAGIPFPDCPNHEKLPTEWKALLNIDPEHHVPNTAGRINSKTTRKLSIHR
jgi:hypothetical protein